MKIAITGGSGLIGSALRRELGRDHLIVPLARRQPGQPATGSWDPATGQVDVAALDGADVLIHLAGANIAAARWNRRVKLQIRDSRVRATWLLCQRLCELATPPRLFICASSVGYYGNRGDEELSEESQPGLGFLAQVAHDWETASKTMRQKEVRIVNLRFGVVLSREGGLLPRLARLFRLHLGAQWGNGRQQLSWIALPDVVGIVRLVLENESIQNGVNVCTPEPVSNAEFTKALAQALGCRARLRIPAFLLRLLVGELADEVLLSSTRALPVRLIESGYSFRYPELGSALTGLLND